ncbi:MAG: MFS transporter [Bacteroidales bacterium]|jgi:FSR family fosmidomycin resistance protein-like MFS transporter
MSKQRFQTGNVLTISLAHFFHDVYTAFLAPVLPILIEKLKLNYTMAALLTVIQRLPTLFNPLIGILAENVKVRYLVIAAPAVTTLCMSFIGVAESYVVLAILLFVAGISSAVFHVPTPVLMKKVSGNKVGQGMSFYMIGGEAARSVGPLVILGVVSLWGFEYSYRLIPFGLLASVLLYSRVSKITISEDLQKKKGPKNLKQTFRKHLVFFLLFAAILFFRGLAKSALVSFLPTYLKLRGESLWFGGISLSVFQGAGVVGGFVAGSLSDKLGRMRMLKWIVVITPFLMFLFISLSGFWVFPALLLLGFFVLANSPIMLALVVEVDTKHHSFLNSIYMTLNFVAASGTTFLVGIVSDWTGLEQTYLIAAIASFGAVPFIFLLERHCRGKLC